MYACMYVCMYVYTQWGYTSIYISTPDVSSRFLDDEAECTYVSLFGARRVLCRPASYL